MHKRGLCRHALSICLSVCVSVTFVDCVKTNKHIFELFSLPGSQAILVFTHQTGWRYSDEDTPPPNGTSNAGGVGRNRDFEPISDFCQLLTLQQARCCQHDRRWTMATVRQVDTYIAGRILRVCRYSTTKRHARLPSPWFYSARPTKRAHSRTIHSYGRPRIVCMTARLDVTPKTTEQNRIVRTGKSEAEV